MASQDDKTEQKTERFNMFMSPSEMQAIDDWAWENKIRSKSEAVRRLCRLGLDTDKIFQELTDQIFELHGIIAGHDIETKSEFSEKLLRSMWDMMQPFMKLRTAVLTMRHAQPIEDSFSDIESALKYIDERDPKEFDRMRNAILNLLSKEDTEEGIDPKSDE